MAWQDLGQVVPDIEYIDIQASDYNPNINDTITITITATNQSGNPIANQTYTLKENGETLTSLTTNSNGVATYTYTCSDWGVHKLSINSFVTFIRISGWISQACTSYGTLYINEADRICELRYSRTFDGADADKFYTWHEGAIPSQYRPSTQVQGAINQVGIIYTDSTGIIGGKLSKSWTGNRLVVGSIMWHY